MKILIEDRILYRLSTTNELEQTKTQAIAKHINVSVRGTQTYLDKLIAKDMIARDSKVSREGRRCYYYSLTKRGKQEAELLNIIQQHGLKRGITYI